METTDTPGTTPAENATNTESASTGRRNGNQSGPRNGNRNYRRGTTSQTDIKNFTGETPELNAVLSLVSERVDKGAPFERYQELLKIYVLKNFNRGEDVLPIVTDITDPKTDFETKYMPSDLSDVDEKKTLKVKMWELRIKRYLDREETLEQNILKLYAITLGQCTPALQSTLKGEADYEAKSKGFDILWLMTNLKINNRGSRHKRKFRTRIV